MCPHQLFRPLEYNYRSSRPVRTLFNLLNRSWLFYTGTLLVLIIKHSPV